MWHATACDALNNTGVNIEIEIKSKGEGERQWGRRSECATSTAAGQLVTLKTSTQVAIAFLCPCHFPLPCLLSCPFFFPSFSRFPSRVVDDNDDDPISISNRTPHPAPADAVTIVVCHGELPHIPCSCTISSIPSSPFASPSPAVPPIPLVLLCSRLINFCAVACPSLNPCALWCHVRNCTYHFCYPPLHPPHAKRLLLPAALPHAIINPHTSQP